MRTGPNAKIGIFKRAKKGLEDSGKRFGGREREGVKSRAPAGRPKYYPRIISAAIETTENASQTIP